MHTYSREKAGKSLCTAYLHTSMCMGSTPMSFKSLLELSFHCKLIRVTEWKMPSCFRHGDCHLIEYCSTLKCMADLPDWYGSRVQAILTTACLGTLEVISPDCSMFGSHRYTIFLIKSRVVFIMLIAWKDGNMCLFLLNALKVIPNSTTHPRAVDLYCTTFCFTGSQFPCTLHDQVIYPWHHSAPVGWRTRMKGTKRHSCWIQFKEFKET